MNKKQNKTSNVKRTRTMNNKEEYTSEINPSTRTKSKRKGTSKK
ncbi:MAG: hypothetical protein ACI4U5_06055 [Bacilli bacterium]